MLNTENNQFTVDSELTQVATYFNIVDNAISTGDTNKKYKIATNSCEAAPAPFKIGGWTSVPISPQGENMADLYNSYITVNLHLGPLTYAAEKALATIGEPVAGQPQPQLGFTFKDSFDAVEQYSLVANGQTFYTQSFATHESYITNLTTTEAVKNVDVFSKVKHEDVWNNNDTARCVAWYRASDHAEETTDEKKRHTIPLKIDLRRFLPLSAIKYLPEFVGNFEIRIKFGISGLVVAQMGPEALAGNSLNLNKLTLTGPITNKFVPYSEFVNNGITGITAGTGLALTAGKVSGRFVNVPSVTECKSHIACFGLDQNIYQQLITHYTSGPALSFPIQTLTFHQMNGNLGSGNPTSVSLSAVPRFVDSIYVMFPKTSEYTTCYENILAENFALKMGGYGQMPEITYPSYGPEYYELITNVFNTNNDISGFNKDVMRSMVNNKVSSVGYRSNDVTNFILGFPTSTDNTFQQGQTSNTTINYQLRLTLDSQDGDKVKNPFVQNKDCNPIIGFLKDSVLAIQLQEYGPPIISLDEYDITSPSV